MRRVAPTLCAALSAAALLSGCDYGVPPEDPGDVSMALVVGPDGVGSVHLGFGDRPDAAQLEAMATELTSSGFVERPPQPTIDPKGGGDPFLILHADDVFQPGSAPEAHIDLRELCEQVLDLGYESVRITLSEPYTNHEWSLTPADAAWETDWIQTCAAAPSGTLLLNPQPWRWFVAMILLVVCVAANVAILLLRRNRVERRNLIVALGVVAVLTTVINVLTAAGAQGDSLVVVGWINAGWPTTVLLALPVLVLPLGVVAFVQLMITITASRQRGGEEPNVAEPDSFSSPF